MKKTLAVALGLLLAGGTLYAQQYLITTAAGGGVPATPAPAASASFAFPVAVAADGLGNMYFIAVNCVFKVDAAGVLTRVAGSSARGGYSGDGGPATSAQLNNPQGVAADASGNVYIADTGNAAVRKVAANGTITTLPGSVGAPYGIAVDAGGNLYVANPRENAIRKLAADGGIAIVAGGADFGYLGDGGPAISAQLNSPYGVAVDPAGNLYIADTGNYAVRKVGLNGIITTVAGNGNLGYSGDGGPATSARLNAPYSVAADAAGKIYIADSGNNVVRKVGVKGTITTLAGNGIAGYSGDGGPAAAAQLTNPSGVALDAGNLYIADSNNDAIRQVALASSVIATMAGNGIPGLTGDGGAATGAQLSWPTGEALDGAGNLYIADTNDNAIRKVAADGTISTVAGKGTPGYSGDRGPATSAQLNSPWGVALDRSGNLYIADSGNFVIRKVANGVITTVAGNGSAGHSGDGGPALSAGLSYPYDVALDAAGNLYVAEPRDATIRMVASKTGIITTVAGTRTQGYSGDGGPATAAELNYPYRVTLDAAGNLYIADSGNSVVRRVAAATGIITTAAGNGTWGHSGDGGPAIDAQLGTPWDVATDAAGNLYIADWGAASIRKVAGGIITAIAGNATGSLGDGGPATGAQISPQGIAVDAAGNVYAADTQTNLIRLLTPQGSRGLLSVALTPGAGFFVQGQTGATYSVVVSNAAAAGPTSGAVTVTDIPPATLTLVSMSGTGWNCSGAACTRSDTLNPGASYPAITVTANVAQDAPSQVMNEVAVSGGGAAAASATNLTTIHSQPALPLLNSPANGATAVLVAPTLIWNAAAGATSYDVYFGTQSPPPLVTTTTGTTYAPGTLAAGATYYWQVVAVNEAAGVSSETWSFTTGVPAAGARFIPVAPCRVADTRHPIGTFGGPTMTAGSTRSFPIPQSGCHVPSTAQAYSLNVTVVPEGQLGFLTLWPAGDAQPFVSTLNSWGADVVANAALVPAGVGGAVSVFASDQTDVLLDIDGYFDSTGASFYAAPPCRVADTRGPAGQFGAPSMFAGQIRDFPLPSGSCGIPASATAYSLNVTAVPATSFLGYLTTWPTGSSRPFVSTLNSWTGDVVANAAVVPAGTNESVSVFVTDPADVILDVNGYFGAPGNAGALAFYPVAPCRVADTRNPAGPFGGPEMEAGSTRSFAIPASGCYVPSTAAAYSVNVTVAPDGPLSYLSAWAAGSAQPNVSTLNSWKGAVAANAAIVQAGTSGAISIYVSQRTHVILDINGYFAP